METPGASRAELRRRSTDTAERPAVVWDRPAGGVSASSDDANTVPAVGENAFAAEVAVASALVAAMPDADASLPADPTDAPEAPRRSRRAARMERIATGEQPIIADAAADVEEPVLLDDAVVEVAPVLDVVPAVAEPVEIVVESPAEPLVDPVLTPAEPFELLEPAFVPADEQEASEPDIAASVADEFEAAARLFSFTGETPVQSAASSQGAAADEEDASAPHVAPRRRGVSRGAAFKRMAAASFSIGVVGVVGLLTVGITMPAAAAAASKSGVSATTSISAKSSDVVTAGGTLAVDPDEIQAYVAPATIQNTALDRDETYATASMADLASEYAIARPSDFYVNDMNAAIQWPFAVGVAITWGFVWRDGRQHNGADFVPGEGAHVQAIADGTVRIATESGGGFGVTVLIDHVIDGQLVSSRYAHMLVGSLQVKPGDKVTVGQYLGRTGNTGHSFGAHTHFEILAGGTTPIDPIAWLRKNAGRDSLG